MLHMQNYHLLVELGRLIRLQFTRIITWARSNPEGKRAEAAIVQTILIQCPMLICTEAWSLAVMTLFVAELQEQKENTAQQPQQHKHQSMQKQMRKFFFFWEKQTRKLGQDLPLTGDIEVHHLTLLVLHGDGWGSYCSSVCERWSKQSGPYTVQVQPPYL